MARATNITLQAHERELLRGFFAALAESNVTTIHWHDGRTVVRFQNAVSSLEEYLKSHDNEESVQLRRVVRRLRPDPLTGLSLAFERALTELLTSGLSSQKNRDEVFLPIAQNAIAQVISSMSEIEQRAIRQMAKAFLGRRDREDPSPSAEEST